MKKAIQIFVALIFILQWPVQAESQVLRRAANRLGQKVVEKKIDREIEKKTDELADSIVNAMEKDPPKTEEEKARAAENRKKSGQLLGRMMGGINQVDLPESYTFDKKIRMELEDEKGEITYLTMYHKDGSSALGYETETEKKEEMPFIVMDFEKEYIATFSESKGEKQAMSMPLPMDMMMAMAEEADREEENEEYSFKKTGKTRTINGFHCEQYIMSDKNYQQEMWVTSDVPAFSGFDALMKKMMAENKRMGKVDSDWPSGFLIEIITERVKNGKKSYMRTKEISDVNFSFPAGEYPYMTLGN